MGKIYRLLLDPRNAARVERYRHRFRFFYNPEREVWYATEHAIGVARRKGIRFEIHSEQDSDKAGVTIIDSFPASLEEPPPQDAKDEIIACALAGEKDGVCPSPIYVGRNPDLSLHPHAFALDVGGGSRRYTWRFRQPNEDVEPISIPARFKRLLSVMRDPDTKVVLSLGGAGVKVYAETVLFRLIDALGAKNDIDEIWGSSAGAVGGLWYACDVPADEIEQSGYDLYNKRFSLRLTPSKFGVLKNLAAQHLLPEWLRPSGFAGFIDTAKSIYDFIFKVKQYRQPRIPFFCIAFNVNEFRPEILTPMHFDIEEYRDLIFTVDPIDAAVASSSMPVLFVPKEIRRVDRVASYIDGMTTEAVPMVSVYKKWLIDRKLGIEKRTKLFILSAKFTQNTIYELKPNRRISGLQMMFIYHDALLNAMVESQRALVNRDPNVQMLEIATPLHEWNNFDIFGIPIFIKQSCVHFVNGLLEFERQGFTDSGV